MSLPDKIRGLVKMQHKSNTDLAEHLGIPRQTLQNKLYRNRFSAEDMIRIADFLGCELLYQKDGKTVMGFDLEDVPEKKSGEESEGENAEEKAE